MPMDSGADSGVELYFFNTARRGPHVPQGRYGAVAELKKKMCKIGKDDFRKNEEAVIAQVLSPKYICTKCLRVASDKKLLCKPRKLES